MNSSRRSTSGFTRRSTRSNSYSPLSSPLSSFVSSSGSNRTNWRTRNGSISPNSLSSSSSSFLSSSSSSSSSNRRKSSTPTSLSNRSIKSNRSVSPIFDIIDDIAKLWYSKRIGFYTYSPSTGYYILYLGNPTENYNQDIKNGYIKYNIMDQENIDFKNHLHIQLSQDRDNNDYVVTQKYVGPNNTNNHLCLMNNINRKYRKYSKEGHDHESIILFFVKSLYLKSGYFNFYFKDKNDKSIINKSVFFNSLNSELIKNPYKYHNPSCSIVQEDSFTKDFQSPVNNSKRDNNNDFVKINNNKKPFELTSSEISSKNLLPKSTNSVGFRPLPSLRKGLGPFSLRPSSRSPSLTPPPASLSGGSRKLYKYIKKLTKKILKKLN